LRTSLVAAVVLAVLAGCGATAEATPEPRAISGSFTLHATGAGWSEDAAGCRGDGGYSDIRSGMQITLRDETGRVMGTTSFPVGRVEGAGLRCVFEFEFTDAPEAEFYTLDSGRRGELTYSVAELEDRGWHVGIDIGR